MMRHATPGDIPRLQTVYDEAITHAGRVSFTDWPTPFPAPLLEAYIANNELYCFDNRGDIEAAAAISEHHDERIWDEPGEAQNFLYIGKLATAHSVRGTRFMHRIILPAMRELALARGRDGLRLDCLASTPALGAFYDRVGFSDRGTITLFSRTVGHDILLDRKEMLVGED